MLIVKTFYINFHTYKIFPCHNYFIFYDISLITKQKKSDLSDKPETFGGTMNVSEFYPKIAEMTLEAQRMCHNFNFGGTMTVPDLLCLSIKIYFSINMLK